MAIIQQHRCRNTNSKILDRLDIDILESSAYEFATYEYEAFKRMEILHATCFPFRRQVRCDISIDRPVAIGIEISAQKNMPNSITGICGTD